LKAIETVERFAKREASREEVRADEEKTYFAEALAAVVSDVAYAAYAATTDESETGEAFSALVSHAVVVTAENATKDSMKARQALKRIADLVRSDWPGVPVP
jgi:hypothetical protein